MSDPVLDLLNEKGIPFKVSGQDYVTTCLSPEHDDKSPSFRIDKVTGIFHCFSCGFKGNLFKHFGILTNHSSIKVAKLKEKLKGLKVSFEGQPLPEGATPYTQAYRGVRPETLRHFGAFTTYREELLADRIVFPITDIRGKNLLFVARHMLSNGNPRYVNFPKNVEMPLFPVRYDKHYKSVVLVEGIFDLLNLYDKGLKNVACCFGTNTLQKDLALKLLPLKAQGITKVYLLFDGDDAGKEAAEKLLPLIEEQNFVVEAITLAEGDDPGDLDQENVDMINSYVNT